MPFRRITQNSKKPTARLDCYVARYSNTRRTVCTVSYPALRAPCTRIARYGFTVLEKLNCLSKTRRKLNLRESRMGYTQTN